MPSAKPESPLRKPFKPGVAWTAEQQNILRESWGKPGMTLHRIGQLVKRSPAAVRAVAIKLGLHNGTDHRFKGSNPQRADYEEPTELPRFIIGAQDGMLQVYAATFENTAEAAIMALEWTRKTGRKAGVYRLISDEELYGGSKDEAISGSSGDCACGCCSGSQSGASVLPPVGSGSSRGGTSGNGSRARRGSPRQVRQPVRRAGRDGRED